ncbi:DUF6701 domain-containing protein [Pelomicrobium methylotrophicum]|uniref:DUF6701 domain-containing protein n=1 Tax=Pelomicrobium methylotrophicum TaxID=2602750 RepID=A0A5C7EZ85_9PROT|nr:DUF6701 domain-containing protein [Pelomicrobium methylotrophicum]TXF13721.1 hypothetical protein FR698_01030 [Pelomicrobium methylotrophicum]
MKGLFFFRWRAVAAGLLLGFLFSGWAQAQIAFRAASSAAVAGAATVAYGGSGSFAVRGNCGSISPGLPPGTAAGDLLIAVVASGASPTLSMPGWTLLFQDNPVSNLTSAIYWRIATGGDSTTITQSGTCNVLAARISRFTGVDAQQPFMTAPLAASNWSYQNANTVTTGTETTDYPGAMLAVTTHSTDDDTFGALGGFSQAYSSRTTTGNDAAIALYYAPQAAPGTAGPYTVTKNRGADPNHGTLFALRPAGLKLTIPVPAGTQANDVMIASIALQPCSAASGGACVTSVNPPAGWTLVRTVDQTTGPIPFSSPLVYGNRLFIYRRVATGTEPASYTWTLGGALKPTGAVGGMTSFSGVDTTNPIVTEAGQATPSSLSHTAPSIDTGAVTDTMLLSSHAANASTQWTPPSGMTERVDVASQTPPNVTGISLEMNSEPRAAAGPTGTRTASFQSSLLPATGTTHMLALRPAPVFQHYAIGVLSTSVATCDYAEITITAHNAAHAPVSPPAGRTLTLSTSTGTGAWQPGLVSGSGAWSPSGANNGMATYVWPGGESSFTVRLRHATVATLSVNLIDDAGRTENAAEDPAIAFVESAFRVSNGANAPLAIGTQVAGKPSNVGAGAQALYLQAVRTDTQTGACVSLFPSGSEVAIEVGAQCVNPATCTQPVTLATAASSGNTASFVPNGGYPATINFRFTTANAEAPFSFSYADAGQIRLQFRRALPPPPSGVYIQGTSNAFVTRPFGLAFRGANAATPIQHGTSPASPVLAAAGDPFTMTVAAYRWAAAEDDGTGNPLPGANITDNGMTPNFAADVTVSAIANLPGVALGTAARGAGCSGPATVPAAAWSGGAATLTDWCYTEVGNVFLSASVSNYLAPGVNVAGNSGLDGSGPAGGYVGRFRPKYFTVANANLTNRVLAGCSPASTFTYMEEAMETGFKLSAKNALDGVTQNYTTASGYAKLDPAGSPASLGFGARNGTTNLTARLDLGSASGSFVAGEATVAARVSLRRASPDNPDGPFEAFELGIAPQDADGVALRPADLNLDVDGVGGNDHVKVGQTRVRFGRLRLANAYGSELLDLPIPIRVEHWNGVGFVTNGDDGCTRLAASNVLLFNYQGNLNPGETSVAPAPTISFSAGVGNLKLTKPGAGNTGSVQLRVDLTAESKRYLKGRWNDAADPDGNVATFYDDDPVARASFGQYKASERIIYLRENY